MIWLEKSGVVVSILIIISVWLTLKFRFSVGSFGRVMLARNKRTGEFFAMKRLKKSDIIKLSQVDHVISENTILADIDHPFLVSMTRSLPGLIRWRVYRSFNYYLNSWLFFQIGWPVGIHLRFPLSLLPDAVHSRRRALHLPAHRG